MRILEKYVIKDYIGAFFFCIALLIVLGVIGDILGFLDDIFKNNIPLKSILAFYLYLAPFAFVNMVPFACLLSAVYVFNSLSRSQEVTAVITSGVSLWKLLRPVVFVTAILSLVTFLVNDRVVPSTMEKANSIRRNELEARSSKEGPLIKNIALYGGGNQMIFAKSYAPKTKTLSSVIIHKHDKDRAVREKISARLVKWTSGGWEGEDILIFNVAPNGDFVGDPEVYKKMSIAMEEKPNDFIANQWDPRFMSYGQLSEYIRAFQGTAPLTVRRLLVDLYYKFAFPFTALVMVIVGVPFSIETGRSNALIGMAKGITIAMVYLPVMAFSMALGKGGALSPVISVLLPQGVFLLFGAYFINKKS